MIQDAVYCENDFEDLLKISPAEFEYCQFSGINFADMNLKRSIFADCKVSNGNMAGQNLVGATFRDVQFIGCKLMGVNWSTLNRFEGCTFLDCKLDLSCFQGLKLKHLKLVNCSVKEADFSEAHLSEADFSGSFLTGTSFVRADLTKADLRTAKEYYIDPSFTKIKGARFGLPEALSLLVALGCKVE